jgi:hypothetical protein
MFRRSRLLWAFLAVIWAVATGTVGSGAQSPSSSPWKPPLAPDGHPDLQGTWINNSATPLERPDVVKGRATLTEAEIAELNRRAARFQSDNDNDATGGDAFFRAIWNDVKGFKSPGATGGQEYMERMVFERRTSLITDPVDGRLPPYTADGKRRLDAQNAVASNVMPEGPESLPNTVRCITFGTPRFTYPSILNYYQLVQTPGYVMFFTEAMHVARVIPLKGRPHLPPSIQLWEGDSRGSWVGQTLVVDTTNFSSKSRLMGAAEHLHLIERFTRIASDVLAYEITVDDPSTWTRPWTAMIHMKSTTAQMFEFACHEGGFESMKGILGAARAAERSGVQER